MSKDNPIYDRRLIINTLLSTILLFILTGTKLFAQGTEIFVKKSQGFFIGFNINPAHTYINNSGTKPIKDIVTSGKYMVSGSLEAGFFLNRNIGLSAGIGYNSYSSELSLAEYSDSLTTKDTEQETYRRIISGIEISETQKIGLLSVPVLVNLNIPFNDNFGLFLQTGINLSLPVTKKYISSGKMTYKGYYPAYAVYIYGIDHEDFATDVVSEEEGTLMVKSFDPELVISGGFQFGLEKKIQIIAGFFFNKLLSDVSDYPVTSSYYLSMKKNDMNSLMQGSTKATAQAIGIKIGFMYFLR